MTDYKPINILLTGGAGFIGSNVVCYLMQKYKDIYIVCLDCLNYCGTTKNFEEIIDGPNFKFIKGNIESSDLIEHIIETYKIDTIMHYAAQSHVDNSFGNSILFTKSNVLGTHTLLEASKKFSKQIRRFIHVSTDEVYGESLVNEDKKTVNSRLDPTNPYAATKAAAELLVKSYYKSFDLPIIITRGNNVYGPKQYPEKLIPKFINLLAYNKSCPLHGDGSHRRSFLYIQDVVDAFDIILHKGVIGETYNIGTNFEITNKEVLETLIKEFGYEKSDDYIIYSRDRAFNDFRYHIDCSSLEKLGWKQNVDFQNGIKMTKKWYLENLGWFGNIDNALSAHPVVEQTIIGK